MHRIFLAAASIFIAAGCNPNPYCLNCGAQDFAAPADLVQQRDVGSSGDLIRMGADMDTDMCSGMAEVCNGKDDDCDGIIDNVPRDKACLDGNNCGMCGNACLFRHAYGLCGGVNNCVCVMGDCQPGFYDQNKDPKDGCEVACIPTPPLKCQAAKDCSFGLPCNGGSCSLACKADNECPAKTICDPDTKLCEGEICDGIDNNCNGKIDEGYDLKNDVNNCGACNTICNFPNAVAGCSNSACVLVSCKPGFYDLDKKIENGCEYACVDAKMMPIVQPGAETCNGVDDDCDGVIDNHLTDVGGPCDDYCPMLAACVANNSCGFALSQCKGKCCGVCTEGTTLCAGGQKVCQAGMGPKLEVCNGVDDNCDGQIDEGYNLQTDPLNCGKCGTVCTRANAVAGCAAAKCTIVSCKPGFADLDKNPDNGCEYMCPVNPPTVETCNGKDDDCNGAIDDNLMQPNNFCTQTGPCAGASPVCCGGAGWLCNYKSINAKIETMMAAMCQGGAQGSNLVFNETLCDGFDGNCNGQIDESFMNLGKACFVGQGACQGQAKFICDPNNPMQTSCPAAANAMNATDELCNGIDDDCDGVVDERTPAMGSTCFINGGGAHPCVGWVDPMVKFTGVNAKVAYVYKYEASRTDATAMAQGTATNRACSAATVQPWAPVTWDQANLACNAIKDSMGMPMRLCDADEWSAACSVGINGDVWSFATNPTIYQNGMIDNSKVCNGFDQGLAKAWATGAGANCFANQPNGSVFDLSGNVSEWTRTAVMYMGTTYYKVRGGAFNNFGGGMSCNFDFVIETPSYQYSDLGFRCCADNPP